MNDFLKENKELIVIIIVFFIIGGWFYFSHRYQNISSNPQLGSLNNTKGEVVKGCLDYRQAKNFIGQTKCVYGKIVKVYISQKGTAFLDFCQDYKSCPFSAVIFKSDVSRFPGLKEYEGHYIKLTGLIKSYGGRAEIIIHEPRQIKVK